MAAPAPVNFDMQPPQGPPSWKFELRALQVDKNLLAGALEKVVEQNILRLVRKHDLLSLVVRNGVCNITARNQQNVAAAASSVITLVKEPVCILLIDPRVAIALRLLKTEMKEFSNRTSCWAHILWQPYAVQCYGLDADAAYNYVFALCEKVRKCSGPSGFNHQCVLEYTYPPSFRPIVKSHIERLEELTGAWVCIKDTPGEATVTTPTVVQCFGTQKNITKIIRYIAQIAKTEMPSQPLTAANTGTPYGIAPLLCDINFQPVTITSFVDDTPRAIPSPTNRQGTPTTIYPLNPSDPPTVQRHQTPPSQPRTPPHHPHLQPQQAGNKSIPTTPPLHPSLATYAHPQQSQQQQRNSPHNPHKNITGMSPAARTTAEFIHTHQQQPHAGSESGFVNNFAPQQQKLSQHQHAHPHNKPQSPVHNHHQQKAQQYSQHLMRQGQAQAQQHLQNHSVELLQQRVAATTALDMMTRQASTKYNPPTLFKGTPSHAVPQQGHSHQPPPQQQAALHNVGKRGQHGGSGASTPTHQSGARTPTTPQSPFHGGQASPHLPNHTLQAQLQHAATKLTATAASQQPVQQAAQSQQLARPTGSYAPNQKTGPNMFIYNSPSTSTQHKATSDHEAAPSNTMTQPITAEAQAVPQLNALNQLLANSDITSLATNTVNNNNSINPMDTVNTNTINPKAFSLLGVLGAVAVAMPQPVPTNPTTTQGKSSGSSTPGSSSSSTPTAPSLPQYPDESTSIWGNSGTSASTGDNWDNAWSAGDLIGKNSAALKDISPALNWYKFTPNSTNNNKDASNSQQTSNNTPPNIQQNCTVTNSEGKDVPLQDGMINIEALLGDFSNQLTGGGSRQQSTDCKNGNIPNNAAKLEGMNELLRFGPEGNNDLKGGCWGLGASSLIEDLSSTQDTKFNINNMLSLLNQKIAASSQENEAQQPNDATQADNKREGLETEGTATNEVAEADGTPTNESVEADSKSGGNDVTEEAKNNAEANDTVQDENKSEKKPMDNNGLTVSSNEHGKGEIESDEPGENNSGGSTAEQQEMLTNLLQK